MFFSKTPQNPAIKKNVVRSKDDTIVHTPRLRNPDSISDEGELSDEKITPFKTNQVYPHFRMRARNEKSLQEAKKRKEEIAEKKKANQDEKKDERKEPGEDDNTKAGQTKDDRDTKPIQCARPKSGEGRQHQYIPSQRQYNNANQNNCYQDVRECEHSPQGLSRDERSYGRGRDDPYSSSSCNKQSQCDPRYTDSVSAARQRNDGNSNGWGNRSRQHNSRCDPVRQPSQQQPQQRRQPQQQQPQHRRQPPPLCMQPPPQCMQPQRETRFESDDSFDQDKRIGPSCGHDDAYSVGWGSKSRYCEPKGIPDYKKSSETLAEQEVVAEEPDPKPDPNTKKKRGKKGPDVETMKADAEAKKAGAEAKKAEAEAKKADAEAKKAEADAKKAEKKVEKVETTEAKKAESKKRESRPSDGNIEFESPGTSESKKKGKKNKKEKAAPVAPSFSD